MLERDAPTRVHAGTERTIAIDCDVPADEEWVLDHHEADPRMRDEIHERVAALTAALRSVATERSAE